MVIYTILSYNVLSGIHDQAYPLPDRITSIIEYIKSKKPDIACLQEVTKTCYHIIHTQLTQCGYTVNGTFVGNQYVVILTKFHHTSTTIKCDNNKAILVASDNQTQIIGIHLTSDMAKNSESKRKSQLELVLNAISPVLPYTIILGDVNMYTSIDQFSEYIDCGVKQSNHENGQPTFDTRTNTIAKSCNDRIIIGRFDRIYVKGGQLLDYIVDTQTILSDHYPILARVDF